MIEPATLSDLIAQDPVTPLRDAIRDSLDTLFIGVTVKAHHGKLDIYDVVKREVVQAPGIALGWTRIKSPRDVSGAYALPVEFAAYIVAEDTADKATRKRISREAVAHAIGARLLAILQDPDMAGWGLQNVSLPDGDPGPELKPIFTATAYEKGTAYYAVTWTQTIIDQGLDFLGGATPAFVAPDEERGPGLKFASEGDLPPEVIAMIAEGEG